MAFNASPIFSNYDKYKDKYNLCCAVMDRIETSVKYLNSHMQYPFAEEPDLVTFVVYACMLVDGVKVLYERVFHESAYNKEKKYFIHAQQQRFLNLQEEDYIDDDKFFEYFRSVVFAHPYNTDRTFKNIYGSQVSPYVLCGYTPVNLLGEISDPIGAKIYTSKERRNGGDIILLEVSFRQFINYLNSRYNKLFKVIEWLKKEKIETEEKWKNEKIYASDNPILTLLDISRVLNERLMTNYGVNQLLYYLSCKISNLDNEKLIEIYRGKIIERIPDIINAVNLLDEERIDEIIYELTRSPDNVKGEHYYQLEKIYSYLHESDEIIKPIESSNEEWGLIQADKFSKGFASKWVNINAYNMPTSEIKLLVAVACYFENHKKEYSYLIKK